MFELFLSFNSYGRLSFRIKYIHINLVLNSIKLKEERIFSHNEQIDIFSSLDKRSRVEILKDH